MDGRDNNDSVHDIEVGVIAQLSENQESVREIILASRNNPDKSFEEGLVANLGYDDDTIIAMVLAKNEISQSELDEMDLMWAGAVLDHLDTLGYQVVRKRKRNGR